MDPLYEFVARLPVGKWVEYDYGSSEAARRQQQNFLRAMNERGVRIKTQRTGSLVRLQVLGGTPQ